MGIGLTRVGTVFAVTAAAAVAAGLYLGLRDVVALGAALAACLGAAVVTVVRRAGVEAERTLPNRRVPEGGRATVVLTVRRRGRSRHPRRLTVRDSVAGEAVVVAVPPAAGRADPTITYDLPVPGRGHHLVGPLVLERSDVLGLVRGRRHLTATTTLIVHPRVVDLHAGPSARHAADDDDTDAAPVRHLAPALHSLRDYEPGDDVRLIHWPSTARFGQVMVRDPVMVDETVVILLDTSHGAYSGAEAFEDAVRLAASVVASARARDLPVRLHTTGGTNHRATNDAGRLRLLDVLAAVATGFNDGLRAPTATRVPETARLVVVTGDRAGREVTRLRPVLRRHRSAVVACLGPRTGDRPVAAGVPVLAATTAAGLARRWGTAHR